MQFCCNKINLDNSEMKNDRKDDRMRRAYGSICGINWNRIFLKNDALHGQNLKIRKREAEK